MTRSAQRSCLTLTFAWAFLTLPLLADFASAQARPKAEVVPRVAQSGWDWSVAFSPDGALVLSGGTDNAIKLWEAATGALLRIFEGHSGSVFSVAFSPNGARVLSGGGDHTIKLWDAATGALLRTFEGHTVLVWSVAFSPDGSRVLSGSADNTIKLWDAATGALLRTFEGHSDLVASVAFSPNGSRVLSGSWDKTVKLWDAATGALLRTFEGHTGRVTSVAFSPDGSRVLSGSNDKTAKLWNAETGALLRTFEGHSPEITSVAFSPDGARVLAGDSGNNKMKLWDAATGALLRTFGAIGVYSVAFSPDGSHVISGGEDQAVRLWDPATGALVRAFHERSDPVTSVTFSPDGTRVLSGSWVKTIKLWDAATGALLRTFEGHTDPAFTEYGTVRSVAFSPDGSRVLSGGSDNTVKLWDAATGALLHTFRLPDGDVGSVAFSADGVRVLSRHYWGFRLWNAATGALLQTINLNPWRKNQFAIWSSALSPDGSRVLSGDSDKMVKLWDAATGALLRGFEGHMDRVTSVAFSPDGSRVLSESLDGTLKLWDAATGSLLRTFEGHTGVISPDGSRVLVLTEAGHKLWDLATGALLRTFQRQDILSPLAFSPDGRRIVSGGGGGAIKLWNLEKDKLITLLARGSGSLAITPDGFFSGSLKSSSEAIHIVRGFKSYSTDQMYQALFNPDLIREELAGDPDGEVKKAAGVLDLEKVLGSGQPPIASLISPPSGSLSKEEVIAAEARVTDEGGGIGRIEWRVNGVTAAVSAKPPGNRGDYALRQQVALDPGDNAIDVIAYNGSNLLASLPARTVIKFTGPADQAKPKLHVLAIGINKYVDQGWTRPGSSELLVFRPLALAVKDATSVSEDLKRAAGVEYADVRVTLTLDEEATRVKLERIVDKLAAEIHPRDTFIFFAAGHGISNNGRFYLIPQDYTGGTNPTALERFAIGQDRLQDWFANRIKAKKGVILLDTCESGALVAGHLRSRTEGAASEASVGRLHEATGRPVLTAAALGQFAYEGLIGRSGDRHGLFTWALLDALRNGDTNGNGSIELSELVTHVQTLVPKLAADLGGTGRAAFALPSLAVHQTARFGSRGEDFVLVSRLQ